MITNLGRPGMDGAEVIACVRRSAGASLENWHVLRAGVNRDDMAGVASRPGSGAVMPGEQGRGGQDRLGQYPRFGEKRLRHLPVCHPRDGAMRHFLS
jgi:hypothetical protein